MEAGIKLHVLALVGAGEPQEGLLWQGRLGQPEFGSVGLGTSGREWRCGAVAAAEMGTRWEGRGSGPTRASLWRASPAPTALQAPAQLHS